LIHRLIPFHLPAEKQESPWKHQSSIDYEMKNHCWFQPAVAKVKM
jgi:hypothetical protein